MTTPHRRIGIAIGATAVGLALAPATGVGAVAPFTVDVGGFAQPSTDLDSFYPRNAVVREGDSLRFRFQGFHTVTFPARGGKVPPFIVPGSDPNPATNDPAGAPYWFGTTTPQLLLNPAAAAPTSNRLTVNGSRLVGSGLPSGPAPIVIRFPKRGTYRVVCTVHPRMTGKVTVLPKNATPPSGAVQTRRATEQKAADRVAGQRMLAQARTTAATGSDILAGTGTNRFSVLAFVPARRTVPAGTEVRFRMTGRNEFHTVSFGPVPFLDALQVRAFEQVRPGGVLAAEGTYPSDPPGVTPSVSPTSHGNGFLNSGILADPGLQGGPKSFTVRFATPGQYDYRCLIHPFMRGTITVA